ncbi:hypothetical protein R6Q59_007351 [Mikania micrantha]
MRNLKVHSECCMISFHMGSLPICLEAIPTHVESVHMVDFYLGQGSQWSPFIEAIARIKIFLIITNIKLDQDQASQFDQTKMHLCKF